MTHTVLRIDGSARTTGSVTRDLTTAVIAQLAPDTIITRDLTTGIALIDETWIGANFTPAPDRTPAHQDILKTSDALVAEVAAADTLVIGTPIYNFSVPAALKAWVDQIARAGLTFKYTADGPIGLMTGKRAIIVMASGGTKSGSDIDFATDYLRHFMGFIGITDVQIIAADQMGQGAEDKLQAAQRAISALAA